MDNLQKTTPKLEILISTMNRTSLDFLDVMFKNVDTSKFSILIVNQTTPDRILKSDVSNVRVINSIEKGLSKSRNLAIENAIGDICLLADDDVVYLKDFDKIILESYKRLQDADVITFKTITTENKPFWKYPQKISRIGTFTNCILSIEITFRRSSIVNSEVRFNEHFGLGSTFEDSENYIFFKDLQSHKSLGLFFVPEYIVIHEPFTSSDEIDSDRFVFARSALNFKLYGYAVYVYIIKLLFFLLRKKLIRFNEIMHKFRVAISGIKTYKILNKS